MHYYMRNGGHVEPYSKTPFVLIFAVPYCFVSLPRELRPVIAG